MHKSNFWFCAIFYWLAMSKIQHLQRVQLLKLSLDEAWNFFSSPRNLQKITPTSMKFTVVGDTFSDTMYAGQIIQYKVSPLLGIPLYWMTEITHVKEKVFFIDEQRFGPYTFWHHQHHFKETANGVEMTDLLHYKVPLYALGRIANKLFVEKQVAKIFDYRYQKIKELFG